MIKGSDEKDVQSTGGFFGGYNQSYVDPKQKKLPIMPEANEATSSEGLTDHIN